MRAPAWTAAALLLAGCGGGDAPAPVLAGADAARGAALVDAYGCGSCHVVPGVRGARGVAGPPLDRWARRDFIAGALPNTPANLVLWIVEPGAVEPGTAMPDVGASEADARDMAAYLFTLRGDRNGE